MFYVMIAAVAVACLALAGAIWWACGSYGKRSRARARLKLARDLFRRRREWLEAEFLSLASSSGKPRDMLWSACDFADDVAFARDRNSGQLRALVGITVSFEAVEGGSMEGVEAVGSLRAATAVFLFDGQKWSSEGRAIFNLNPEETIRHYRHELEVAE